MYPQNAYNLVAEIADGKLSDLKKNLDGIQKDVENNPFFNFSKIASIHFARFVILDEVKDSAGQIIYPAYLAFESNYDGELDAHLNDIIKNTKANDGFDKLFRACKTFPAKVDITDKDRINFLKTDSYYHPYFYRGTWGRTVLQIKAEEQTRHNIQDYLNKHPQLRSKSEKEIYAELKQNVKLSPYKTEYPPKLWTLLSVLIPVLLLISLCFLYTIGYGLYYGIYLCASESVIVILGVMDIY